MTSKFLQALAKLKPSSPSEVRAERSNKSETTLHGAVAFQADVYRRKRVGIVANAPIARVVEH